VTLINPRDPSTPTPLVHLHFIIFYFIEHKKEKNQSKPYFKTRHKLYERRKEKKRKKSENRIITKKEKRKKNRY